MALIQFTKNHTDHSPTRDSSLNSSVTAVANGFMSEFKASAAGMLPARCMRPQFFWRHPGTGCFSSYEIERAVQGPAL